MNDYLPSNNSFSCLLYFSSILSNSANFNISVATTTACLILGLCMNLTILISFGFIIIAISYSIILQFLIANFNYNAQTFVRFMRARVEHCNLQNDIFSNFVIQNIYKDKYIRRKKYEILNEQLFRIRRRTGAEILCSYC